MVYEIKKVNSESIRFFADILKEAAQWLEDTGKKNWEPSRFTVENILRESNIDELYLCCADDEPAGCFRMQTKDEFFWPGAPESEALYIHKLAVRRKFSGQGISKIMIDWVKDQALEKGIPYVRLDCIANRKKLCRLYSNLGFSKVHERLMFGKFPTAFFEFTVESGNRHPIVVHEYDSDWKTWFMEISDVIKNQAGDNIIRIEHVGSTSVEGLAAKPIIDMIMVYDEHEDLGKIINNLKGLGYWYNGDQGEPGREVFKRDSVFVPLTEPPSWKIHHHLYACHKDAVPLAEMTAFRDVMRGNDDIRDSYGVLKKELSQKYRNDRLGYTDAKTGFVMSALQKQTDINQGESDE